MNEPPTLPRMLELSESLRGIQSRTRSPLAVANMLREFCFDYTLLGRYSLRADVWMRAVKLSSDEKLTTLRRLIYRPTPPESLGRANLIHRTVLYGASTIPIAMDEIEARAGDRIGVVYFRPKTDRSFTTQVIGEYESIVNSSYSLVGANDNVDSVWNLIRTDYEHHRRSYFVDATLAELFRRGDKEHLVTATYSDDLYRRSSGIVYPSVRLYGGLNIAISANSFDRHFEAISAEQLQMDNYYGKGLYQYTILSTSSVFDRDGGINWNVDPATSCFAERDRYFRVRENYVGWSVPST